MATFSNFQVKMDDAKKKARAYFCGHNAETTLERMRQITYFRASWNVFNLQEFMATFIVAVLRCRLSHKWIQEMYILNNH